MRRAAWGAVIAATTIVAIVLWARSVPCKLHVRSDGDNSDWWWFMVAKTEQGIVPVTKIVPQSDFPVMSNDVPFDLQHTKPLPSEVKFRRTWGATSYGIVFIAYQQFETHDLRHGRVCWLSTDEMNAAVLQGEIEVSDVQSLPQLDLSLLPPR